MAPDYQSLGLALSQQQTGLVLEVVGSLDSTNSELMRRARAGIGQPTLLVAQHQTAGRGRLGRQWLSQEHHTGSDGRRAAGESLTFSLVLPLTVADWSGLSLAVGLSLASSLHPDLRLKWPNDIWLEQRKLAGILIETVAIGSARLAIVGVGINLGPRGASGLARAPAWLQEVLPQIDAPTTLLRLVPELLRTLQEFESLGFAPFRAGFAQRDALFGASVSLSDGTLGSAEGVDARGALLLRTAQGLRAISSDEVSLRAPSTGAKAA